MKLVTIPFFKLFIVLMLLSSCSQYNRILKSDDYTKKFNLANDMFDREKWSQSIALYEQVYQRLPKTSEGEISYFRMGRAYYEVEDFYMSGYYFGSFFEKFPYSNKTEDAFFLKAICSVKNSPNYSLDQTDTEMALNDIQQFIYLYPNSLKIDTCNQIMDNLRLKLEKKEFENIKLYAKTMNYRSAVTASETFLNDHPGSGYKEEIYFIHIKNSFLLSKNSIENKKKERIEKTIESYRTFVAQFPSSKYLKELEGIHEKLKEDLNNVITNSK